MSSSKDSISGTLTHTATHIDAASLITFCLYQQGVRTMYGVIGIPIVEVGQAAQQSSLTFVSCRNEQTASYAASINSYLTSTPAACLSVAGPGVIHSLAGVGNAWANRWAMILISAGVTRASRHQGAFQEADQVDTVRPYVKFAAQIQHIELIPVMVERAVREATYGRPGPVYLELPTELVLAVIDKKSVQWKGKCPPPPRPLASPSSINSAVSLLLSSATPLLILGKGAAYARAEESISHFISVLPIPFLPTPMAKGLLPDTHPLCVSAARSLALSKSDVILVVGARLNWMLHFGDQGRYREGVKIIQIDIAAEEIGNGREVTVPLWGDSASILNQLSSAVEGKRKPEWRDWKDTLASVVKKNNASTHQLGLNTTTPVTYYRAFAALSSVLPSDALLVSEGANTMDISRTCLLHSLPRTRLDAGTFATMGLGVGYAIAAALSSSPPRKVVAVQGDSAFGFSAMDFETVVRYNLNITFVIFNNSGVYGGASEQERAEGEKDVWSQPVTALSYHTEYEKLGEMFGGRGKGWRVEESEEMERVLAAAIQYQGPSIVNLIIQTQQGRKSATHSWMSVGKAKL